MTASENRLNGKLGESWRGTWAAVFAVFLGIAVRQAAVLADNSEGYQSYPLRYSQAEQVESALSPLMPAGTEIVADRKGNRILVRGTAASQELAQRVVASLDKPPAVEDAPVPPSTGQPVLRVYSSAPGKATEMAKQLQDEFGRAPGVRIVADQRTSQVLVLAPADVQAALASRLSASASGSTNGSTGAASGQSAAAPRATNGPTMSAPAEASPKPGAVEQIELSRELAESLEASLASIFGNRLAAVGTAGPGGKEYRLRLNDGGEVWFTVDRQTGRLSYRASGAAAQAFPTLVRVLDHSRQTGGETTRLVPLQSTRAEDARRTVQAIRVSSEGSGPTAVPGRSESTMDPKKTPLAAQILRPGRRTPARVVADATAPAPATPNAPPPAAGTNGAAPAVPAGQEEGGLVGPVQIEMLEGLDVLVIRGNARDVKQVVDIIQQIEKLSIETEPAIEVLALNHVDCSAMSTLVTQIYNQVYSTRQGPVTIIALVKPNALLLVGRKENVERARSLAQLLDVPVKPDAQFQVFRLQHAAAATVQSMIEEHYADPTGLAPVVRVTSDIRSNSLIVHGSPRDLAEVAAMISRIDTDEIAAVNEVQVFKLTHTLAADLAQTLNDAIQSQALGAGRVGAQVGQAAVPAATAAAANQAGLRSSMLQFVTVDAEGKRRLISSGILADVRITADARANTLIVAAPAKSMPLIEALVKQLDQPPAVRALVKVFTIVNGDASTLVQMLNEFFGTTTGTAGFGAAGGTLGGGPPIQTAAGQGESSLVPLRFAADPRTNTIIASGAEGDLLVVEAMLLRLDMGDVKERISTVYRLKNAPASDVATAINNFLRTELQALNIQTTGGALLSPFEQIERQVVVVAEPVSNSLLVAATPRYFDEIKRLVEELDRRPPMVLIQVLIAEVDLADNDEFGVELGLQDGLLFQRGAPPNPGFLFNSATQGNDNTATALQNARFVGGQSLSNFGLGRTTQAGFGGLVLSASSESVSVLIRALKTRQRIDILARPQIQTLDNQTAYINVGQSVPQIRGVTLTQFGQTNNVDYINTGIILGVTPRISPDGIVVMEIDAQRSDVGPESEGIPISVSASGQIIRSPRINQQLAQTTVSATDGQTVVLGGLLSKQITETRRQVPLLGDIPVVGHLFRYDAKVAERRELLIIMTPHIVRTNEDAEAVKRVEAGRMHWCLADVIEMTGDAGLRSRTDEWPDSQTETIYPDGDPRTLPSAPRPPEPTPSPEPSRLTPPPAATHKTTPTGPGT